MDRIVAAARMQAVNPLQSLGIPWLVLASSFLINWPIWALADMASQSQAVTGGIAALYITVVIAYAQSLTQLFPIGMGLSLSRRTFYLGTALYATAEALAYGVLLTVLDAVENASSGWGVGLQFFAPGRMDVGNPVLQVLVFAAPLLLAAALGSGIGVVLKRWGATGLWAAGIGAILAIGGTIVLITWQQAWGSVGTWLTTQPIAVLAIAIPLAGAAVLGLVSHGVLRRAVP